MDTKLLIGVSIIVLVIYLVHYFVDKAGITSVYRYLSFSTAVFMFLGIIIGPAGLGLLKTEDVRALAPLLDILLGWIGWLIGIELTRKMLDLIPNKYWSVGMAENLITLTITVLLFLLIDFILGNYWTISVSIPFLLLTGLCAAVSSPRTIVTLTKLFHIPRDIARSYAVVAHLGNLGVMLMMYLFINFFDYGNGNVSIFIPTLKMVLLGVSQGLIMSWLFWYRRNTPESMLIIIGVITFFSGAAVFMQVPALLVGLIGGGFFAYLFPNRQPQLHQALQQSERPIFLLFITVASINIPLFNKNLYLFLIPFLLFRLIAKLFSGFILKKSLNNKIKGDWNVAVFIPQGALAIAIALSAYQLSPNMWDEILVAAVVIGLLINEIMGYLFLRFTQGRVARE